MYCPFQEMCIFVEFTFGNPESGLILPLFLDILVPFDPNSQQSSQEFKQGKLGKPQKKYYFNGRAIKAYPPRAQWPSELWPSGKKFILSLMAMAKFRYGIIPSSEF